MKALEFETSKGKFVLVDNNQDDTQVIQFLKNIPYGSYINRIKLSEITEEQASEIVDSHINCKRYFYEKTTPQKYYNNALSCLHSLLKSKGIHLFRNPYTSKLNPLEYKQAKQKTFHNPYIFKL